MIAHARYDAKILWPDILLISSSLLRICADFGRLREEVEQ